MDKNKTNDAEMEFSSMDGDASFVQTEESEEWVEPQFAVDTVYDSASSAGSDLFTQTGSEELEVSVIAESTLVVGNVVSKGHLDILGDVQGNVTAKGNVAVQGNIEGNVEGAKIGLFDCRIKGDILASDGIVAGANSEIVGNVKTKNIVLDGKMRGEIQAENVVVFRSNAYFFGDVTTRSIAIETGAIINGNIRTLTEGDPNAPLGNR
jgi:cytoskeletal protein CcmA (bactofilin family)